MKLIDEATWRNARKFVHYGLDAGGFRPHFDEVPISQQANDAAQAIRGRDRGPAILIHGVMPRSGTVYVGELLRLHPVLYAFPNQVWEFPFLKYAPQVFAMQREFLWAYEQNKGKIGDQDFLPLFGSSVIAYLHAATPQGQRMLLKVPSVEHLDRFYHAFPHEHLFMLIRDGRDVVQSTLNTWPQLRFSMVCLRWRHAAQMTLSCHQRYNGREGYWLGRFEDAIREPEVFVRNACQYFGVDANQYPFERIGQIPVHGSSAIKKDGKVTWMPVAQRVGFNPLGRWQKWSRLKKALFKLIAGQQLVALGYAQDTNW